ncbi:serine/threonine-protein kinase [Roseisolibacter agri]|uniref:Protein kinase domain-containing protein n=1 Tax=Roseisolibacter agri TaxID=2014610 RepID=A0AA37Q201_9BACT|nr:serine/threonine-protein kinase [Roseisolibacter agri]GLC25099.1 hypothetical protein rosag_16120 [Roseisolibacter agri]
MRDPLRERLQASLGAAYTLERELGGGGMSRVFVAHDEALGRDVVVKVLAPELAADISAERFAREIRLAAGLQDPHIVPVLAAGVTADGLPYYTMPFVRGASLRQRLGDGAVPLAEAVGVLRDVAAALEHAHAQGIVHRDVKPENVLLSGRSAVVADFGIAKALQASRTQAPGGTLTQIGTSLGTPAYMAPEQAAGDPATDHRADLYAWGVVAYELLAGRHPFTGKTSPQALMAAHFSETPAPLPASVPRPLATLVARCLAKEAAERPAAAADLLAALDGVATGEPPASTARRTRRVAVAVVSLVGVASAAGLALRARTARGADAPSVAVLPFEHRGPADQAFFADGLTDAITGKLVDVQGITVIDRRSASIYKATTKGATQIGRELGVAYLLEGVVAWARDSAGGWRAQVTPTLVRTRDAVARWSGTPIVVTSSDPFRAESEIATRVVDAIGVALRPGERAALSEMPTRVPEAYELFLRAGALVRARRRAEAAVLLERATQLDPKFALAFAELARIEELRARTDSAALPRYEAALRTALALDPNLAEAHFLRAEHLIFRESRLVDAARELARAHALKPGDAEILSELGAVQVATGQRDEGFANLERTARLDPLDARSNYLRVFFLWHFRRLDDAARHAARFAAVNPDDWGGHSALMRVALARGDAAAARRALSDGLHATGRPDADAEDFWMVPATMTPGFGWKRDGAWPGGFEPAGRTPLGFAAVGAWAREHGQTARARAWFDSTLVARGSMLDARSLTVGETAAARAIALAATGRAAEARRAIALADSARRALALPDEPNAAAAQDYLAYAELVLGDTAATLARLERLLAVPSGRTPAMLRTMWPYRSLHGDPRFRRLAEMDR